MRLVQADGSPYPVAGRLLFTDVSVDPGTGQVSLRATFPNPRAALLPGTYVRVRVAHGVKADAVAGLLITAVNFFVGLGVGVVAHGLPVSEALSTYSQLTIGDGLVSQVPALITSMAAALLLSRGGSTESTADLLSQQLAQNWHAPALAAGAMAVLGFVPGMPTLMFLAIAALAGWFAWRNATRPPAAPEEIPLLRIIPR